MTESPTPPPATRVAAGRRGLGVRVLSGFLWSYGGVVLGKASFFFATLVLARLLDPRDFGLVAFALAVLAYVNNLGLHGLGETLVYRSDAKEPRVAATAYWLSIGLSLTIVGALWAVAPTLVALSDLGDEAAWILRALSLYVLIGSLAGTNAYLLRHDLEFRRLFVPDQASGVAKGAVSVAAAFAGAGVWSLVVGQLAGAVTYVLTLLRVSSWRPSLTFAAEEARPLARVGLGFTAVALLGEAARNVDFLLIGVRLGAEELGYYVLAFRLPELAVLTMFEAVWAVLFPYYARVNDSRDAATGAAAALGATYLRTVRMGALVAFPLAAAVAALAAPLVRTLYGERWEPSIWPLALVAGWAALSAVGGLPGTVFKAVGRPGLLTRLVVVYLAVLVPALWVAAGRGIVHVAVAHVVVQGAYFLLLAVVVARVTSIRWYDTLLALVPGLVVAGAVGPALLGLALVLPGVLALVAALPVALAVGGAAAALVARRELASLGPLVRGLRTP